MATPDQWLGGDGNWNTGTLWSLSAPPTSSDIASFPQGTTQTITYDLISSIAGLYAAASTTTIDFQGGVLSTANTETSYVGGSDQTFLGLIDQTGGTLATTGGVQYIASLVQTAGAIVVGAGTELLTSGATLDGTLSGGGAYFLDTGTATIGAGASISVGTLALNGGTTLDLGGDVHYGGQLSGSSATLVLGGHTLTESGRLALSSGAIDGTGEVVLDGNGSLSGVTVAGTVTVLDSGFVVEANNMLLGASGADSVTLSVLPGGVFDVLDNSLIYSSDTTSLISNAGVFEKAAANNTSNIEVPFTQGAGGTLLVQRGVLNFTQGGNLTGLITGAGTLELSSGNYTLAAGTTIDVASLIASTGTTFLQGNLGYDGAFTLGDAALVLDGYTLTLGGTSLFVPYAGVYGGGTLAVGAAGSATIDYLVPRCFGWVATWLCGQLQVEFPGEEVDDGFEVSDRAIASCLGLGGLDQTVDALDEIPDRQADRDDEQHRDDDGSGRRPAQAAGLRGAGIRHHRVFVRHRHDMLLKPVSELGGCEFRPFCNPLYYMSQLDFLMSAAHAYHQATSDAE